jgi:putative ABC transport system permease protein
MRRPLAEQLPSTLVAALSSAFGVCLLETTGVLAQVLSADSVTGSSATVAAMLQIVASVFIIIAVYVGSIVTANTFATIIAGRTRTIALYRLIGSSASDQRRAVAREGLVVGAVGSVIGAVLGSAITIGLVSVSVATGVVPSHPYSYVGPVIVLPIVAVMLTTWLASWVGSRRVLQVSPMQATGGAVEKSLDEASGNRRRNVVAIVLFAIGGALLVLGMVIGLVSPAGVLVGVVGGLLSFTGLVLGSQLVMPVALRLTGRMFGRSAPARLAAENAVRYPVIGVTLITMFAVCVETYQVIITEAQKAQPEVYQGVDQTLTVTVVVFSVLMGFSALIAAVGMVNNLSMSVLQRTRELGLLRALGFTARQVRTMILAESAQLTVAAVLVGLVLGTFYGWAGAQSLLGSITGSPGIVLPAIPLALLAILAVAAAVLTLVASVAPSRRATRIAPVAALAVE